MSAGPAAMDRRGFLRVGLGAGGGLLVAFALPGCGRLPGDAEGAASPARHVFGAFVRVDTDGRVTVRIPVPEIGQGVRTSLAMIVAEELDAPWSSVSVEQADAADDLGPHPVAGGSHAVRAYWLPLRRAGAAARQLLVAAAAERAGEPPDRCSTDAGVVVLPSGGRVPYGEVASDAATRPLPDDPPLADPARFRLVGTPVAQIDAPDIATGAIRFGQDVRLPGMLRATVARCPVHGGRVTRWDDAAARAVPGVRRTVKVDAVGDTPERPYVGEGVAVVADDTWSALQGREALEVTWDEGPNAGEGTDRLHARCRELIARPARTFRQGGDPDARLAGASRTVEATYHVPFIVHAPMETPSCTAHVTDGRCELWAPTQIPVAARANVAALLGLPEDAVTVHALRCGGGFGRRLSLDFVLEAVQVARQVEAPVQVLWTREDDVRHGFLRPFSYHRMLAGLDGAGRVTSWVHRQAATSRYAFRQGADPAHSAFRAGTYPGALFPSHRLEFALAESNLPRGPLRAPGFNAFVFAVESFLDEVAAATGRDPVELRLEMLEGPAGRAAPDRELAYDEDDPVFSTRRMANVIRRAAGAAGWGDPLPPGRGRGVAATFTFGSYVAEVAEVEVDRRAGRLRVHRVVGALDCGRIVNPSGARAQVEGGVMDGLGAALHGEITVAGGRIRQSNFHDFPLLRASEAPRVDVVLIDSDEPPTGAGEPPYPPIGAAVANAVYAAAGVRLRDLPLRLG